MRVALIGVSHWHAHYYLRTCAELSGIRIVGISDPGAWARDRVAADLDVPGYADHRELVAKTRPDFVFAFGRHCDMAAIASWLIEQDVPFLVEKPAGLNHDQVRHLHDRAVAKGLHAGTGFNFRVSDFVRHVDALLVDDEVTETSFRFIAGGPHRYRKTGCAWMLDPALSGGGSTINLSVHFFDLFKRFTKCRTAEVSSFMGNNAWNLPVEDYSSTILRSSNAVCTVETGYTYPGPAQSWDLRFCVRLRHHYVILRSDNVIEIYGTSDGTKVQVQTPSAGNSYWYPLFIRESLERFARGQKPVAGLEELASAMTIVDAAYASNRTGANMTVAV